jgi:hypothetical protein
MCEKTNQGRCGFFESTIVSQISFPQIKKPSARRKFETWLRRVSNMSFDSFDSAPLLTSRTALVIGHPGHELRVYGWLAAVQPKAFILTDGSGATGNGRMPSTLSVLSKAGVASTDLQAVFSDAGIYRAILECDVARFTALVDELAEGFVHDRIEAVASDANEGFNPTHDLCREITYAAVLKARLITGRPIVHYEFCLTEWECGVVETHDERCSHIRLGDEELKGKIEAAHAYRELRGEVEQALAAGGPEHFRVECLRRVDGWSATDPGRKPQYEVLGEQRVAQGKYKTVLRFHEHMLPILLALQSHVRQTKRPAGDLIALEPSLP